MLSVGLKQKDILHFISGNNVFISLPTGSGKFLRFSWLPDVFDEVR